MTREAHENSDLLGGKNRLEKNGNAMHNATAEGPIPPDGGPRAYLVLLAAFLTNGLMFGQINSYSNIKSHLKDHLEAEHVSNASTRAALVGSLTMGMVFLLSPVSGVLTSLMGLRMTTVVGGVVAASSLIVSSFFPENVDALTFTYGIMYGVGASFAYTPSLAILGHYFKKHLGLVNGIVTVGSSVFTVIMPLLMDYMLVNYSLAWLFRLLAVFSLGIALCGLLFKPLSVIPKPARQDNTAKAYIRTIVNVEIWKNRKYKYWALSMPFVFFGYNVVNYNMKDYMKSLFDENTVDLNIPFQCIAVTSAIGKLIFGFLTDIPKIDRIMLQQISFYVFGTLIIILPFAQEYWAIVIISLAIGIFDGALVSLIGPIAFELCGSAFVPQAIGCMLGLAAIPISVGPPIAGVIYEVTNTYTLPFVLAGLSPLIGATVMFAVRIESHCRNRRYDASNGHVVSLSSQDLEKSPAPLLISNGNRNEQTAL